MSTNGVIENLEPCTAANTLVQGVVKGSPYRLLALIILLSVPLRIYWMTTHTPVISLEGSEYVRMAENLANGKGLIGNFEGPETMYSPLLPILTAGVSLLTKNAELAAHLVCFIFGTALTVPVFLIGQMMYGKRVAYISSLFVAFHPFLVKLSASIFNENVYHFLLMMSLYWGLRCLESKRTKDYVLVGLCFGLAYLSRPEAFAYPVFFALTVLFVARVGGKIGWRPAMGSAVIVGAFLLVALPYVWFLYVHTGRVRFEGKWCINYTIASRIRAGMEESEAAYGLGPNNSAAGPLLDPYRFAAYTPYPHSLKDGLESLLAMGRRNERVVHGWVEDPATGSFVLIVLVIIGLFRRPWGLRRLLQELVLLVMAISIFIVTATSSTPEFRYMLPLIPISSLWVGKGLAELGLWSRTVRALLPARWLPSKRAFGIAVPCVALVLMFAISLHGTNENWLFLDEQGDNQDLKEAGAWIKSHSSNPMRVVCSSTVITYYANAIIDGLPYASSDQALSYIRSRRPDFLVLDSRDESSFPQVKDWIERGIPDDHAQLVYDSGPRARNRVEIYRWHDTGPHT